MRVLLALAAAASCVGLGLRAPAAAGDAADLAPPFAVTVDGVPIDLTADSKAKSFWAGVDSFPWLGDFDGDGKLDLLVGQHGRGKSIDGHLRIYRNLGGKGEPRLAKPIWFDDKVPTGRIPDN
jgi:FG-GAP repeat